MRKKLNLVKRYIFHYKNKTIETVIMLMIAFACFIFVNQTTKNIQEINYLNAVKENGYYHILYEDSSLSEFEQIKENDLVDEIGGEWVIGSVLDNTNQFMLLYRDEAYHQLEPFLGNLIEGKLPVKDNEIAVTQNYMERKKLKVGDEVSLPFEKINYNTGELFYKHEMTFTISGIIENWKKYNDINVALVSEKLKDELLKTSLVDNTLIKFRNEKYILNQSEQLIMTLGLTNTVKYNDELIFAIDDNTTIGKVRIIVNLLIFVIFALVLYNIVYFTVISNRKDLGIMTSLGIEKRTLYEIVIYRIIFYFVMAVPLGVLLGIIVNNLLFEKFVIYFFGIEDKELILNAFKVSLDTVLLSGVVTFSVLLPSLLGTIYHIFSDTPIEIINAGNQNISYNKNIRKMKKGFRRVKNRLLNYGIHNVLRNKKRTVISICIMVIAFSIFSTMIIVNNIGARKDYSWIKNVFQAIYVLKEV